MPDYNRCSCAEWGSPCSRDPTGPAPCIAQPGTSPRGVGSPTMKVVITRGEHAPCNRAHVPPGSGPSSSPGMKAVVMMVLVTVTAMNSLLCRSLFHNPLCVWCADIEVPVSRPTCGADEITCISGMYQEGTLSLRVTVPEAKGPPPANRKKRLRINVWNHTVSVAAPAGLPCPAHCTPVGRLSHSLYLRHEGWPRGTGPEGLSPGRSLVRVWVTHLPDPSLGYRHFLEPGEPVWNNCIGITIYDKLQMPLTITEITLSNHPNY